MAVKTITIDLEAYEVLARHKKPGQSFSQVIKERLAPIRTGGDLMAALRRVRAAEPALAGLERVVKARRRDKVRRVEL